MGCLGDDKELSYKLALRGAFLLGKGPRERKIIFSRLREAYKIRGRIVHGSSPPPDIGEVVDYTEDYLRKSLVKFMRLFDKHEFKRLKEELLDQNIIEAGRLLKS